MGTLVLMLSFLYLLGHAGALQNINMDCNSITDIILSNQEVTILRLMTGSDNVCTVNVMSPTGSYFYTYTVDFPSSGNSIVLGGNTITLTSTLPTPVLTSASTIDIDTRSVSSFEIRLFASGSENVPAANNEVGPCPGTVWTTPGYPGEQSSGFSVPVVFEYTFEADEPNVIGLEVSFFFQSICMDGTIEIIDGAGSLVGTIPPVPALAQSTVLVTGTTVTVNITIQPFCDYRGAEFRVCYVPQLNEPGAVCNEDAQCVDNASCCSKERNRVLRSIRKLKKHIERLEKQIQKCTLNDKRRQKLENKLQEKKDDLLVLENNSLPNGRCVCDKGYFSKDGECKAKLNGDCVNNDDCGVENSECVEQKCKCKDGFKAKCGKCKSGARPGLQAFLQES